MGIEDYWGYIRVDPIIAIEEIKDTRIGLLDHQGREICKKPQRIGFAIGNNHSSPIYSVERLNHKTRQY